MPSQEKLPLYPDTVEAVERRRTIRIKRSGLLRNKLGDIDRPAIKIAEGIDELGQAFSRLHESYFRIGYLDRPKPSGMLFSIYSLLPDTVVFVAKSHLTVISTLTEIFDTGPFGLPMDDLYRSELDCLRGQGRRVVELAALVSPEKHRWRNLFMYLAKVMYWYSRYKGVQDVCITVTPRHARFYRNIFFFEEFGPERYFDRVKANGIALRLNLETIEERLRQVYGDEDFDTNLYDYFHRSIDGEPAACGFAPPLPSRKVETVRYFLAKDPAVVKNLSNPQKTFLNEAYPGLNLQ